MATNGLEPGTIIGNYRIVRKLGEGGMGQVYEAWEQEVQRRVALKIIGGDVLAHPNAVERFRGEGRALGRLHHPNVVALYGLGEFQGQTYLAMEFVDGFSLTQFLVERICSLDTLLSLIKKMLSGLEAAHQAGIIHRDLKPENIMVDRAMNVKLVDFGIAKVYSDQKSVVTEVQFIVGTASFLAPEIALGGVAQNQSDIYSLGLVFFYMLTAQNPLAGKNNLEILDKIRTTTPEFDADMQAVIPSEIRAIVSKMMKRPLSERYQSVSEVLSDLNEINRESWPPILKHSGPPTVEFENLGEVRADCVRQGFSPAQTQVILNLASTIETSKIVDESKTAAIDLNPKIILGQDSVREAISQFRSFTSESLKRKVWRRYLVGGFTATLFLAAVATVYIKVESKKNREYPLISPQVGEVEVSRERVWKDGKLISDEVSTSTFRSVDPVLNIETWEDEGGGIEQFYTNPFLPIHAQGKDMKSLQVLNEAVGGVKFLFPLRVGKSGTIQITDRSAGGAVPYNWVCQVSAGIQSDTYAEGQASLDVKCLRDGQPDFGALFHFLPELGRSSSWEQFEGSERRQYELVRPSASR